MQIVIEIPNKQYELIKKSDYNAFSMMVSKECRMYAIKIGTPLPKGHGRLIDADDLSSAIESIKHSKEFCIEHHIDWSVDLGLLRRTIYKFPTIIPADKEAE